MLKKTRILPAGMIIGLVVVSIFPLTGCQRTSPAGNTTVHGRVTFRGQPLSGGLVVFSPDPERGGGGKQLSAEIAQDGQFHLMNAGSTSIPPGWYRVAIAAVSNSTSFSPENRAHFPPQLARPDLSGLSREVKAGQENTFSFDIEVSVAGTRDMGQGAREK